MNGARKVIRGIDIGRFLDVRIGARVVRSCYVRRRQRRRKYHDRYGVQIIIGLDKPQHVVSVHPRKIEVEQNQIWPIDWFVV